MSMNPESPPSSARVSFQLPVGGGFLHASANLPTGQTTLTQLLPIIQNLENAIVGRIGEEAALAGTPISCRAGCGACCRQLVPVSFFEAEALTEWMSTLPEERRVELEGRFHRALLALRDAGVIEKILDDRWTLEEEAATQLAIDYFHARCSMPFSRRRKLQHSPDASFKLPRISCDLAAGTLSGPVCESSRRRPVAAQAVARSLCIRTAIVAGSSRLDSAGIPAGVEKRRPTARGLRRRHRRRSSEEIPRAGGCNATPRKWPAGRDASWPLATTWMSV